MKYLSFDIEATGLNENCQIIEFAMVPFDSEKQIIADEFAFHTFVKCPTFEELKPTLDQWVIDHNEDLIRKANLNGISIQELRNQIKNYCERPEIRKYFGDGRIVLFGKSMSALDLPFLNRDLGWDFMRKYFHHRNLDLSCVSYSLIDMGKIPTGLDSGEKLMKYLGFGEVAHTALEDAVNTAKMYFALLNKLK
jgi:DNA polymerase III epsilon subunit-like protein